VEHELFPNRRPEREFRLMENLWIASQKFLQMQNFNYSLCKKYKKPVMACYKLLIMKLWGRKLSFYVMGFQLCNIKELVAPVTIAVIIKSSL
jgi:hypothetical protein